MQPLGICMHTMLGELKDQSTTHNPYGMGCTFQKLSWLCCRAHIQSNTTPLQEPPSVSSMAPLTPSQTLQAHSSSLTGFEQSEILQFSEIYFWGLPAARKHEGTPHLSELNHGCASR